jgi:hypothetical protein
MPAITHVHNLVVPDPPDTCEIAIFPVAVVPYALAALEYRIPAYVWADSSYVRGVQLVRSLQMALLCGGIREITDRQDALYRMVGTALYGTEYTIESTDPELIVTPEIGPTHELVIEHDDSILGRMEDMRQLLQNALNGTDTPNYDRANGIRDLLESLLTAAESSGSLDPDMLAKLAEIAVLLA